MKKISYLLVLVILLALLCGGCSRQLIGTPMFDRGTFTQAEFDSLYKVKKKLGYTGIVVNSYTDRTIIIELPRHFLKKGGYYPAEISLSPATEIEITANACSHISTAGDGWLLKYRYIYNNGKRSREHKYWLYIDFLPGTQEENLPPRYQGRKYDWFLVFPNPGRQH